MHLNFQGNALFIVFALHFIEGVVGKKLFKKYAEWKRGKPEKVKLLNSRAGASKSVGSKLTLSLLCCGFHRLIAEC